MKKFLCTLLLTAFSSLAAPGPGNLGVLYQPTNNNMVMPTNITFWNPSISNSTLVTNLTDFILGFTGVNQSYEINIQAYGAIPGDGLSDNAAFSNALVRLNLQGGGSIYVPGSTNGTYDISLPILLMSNSRLRGDGPNTRIKLMDGSNTNMVTNSDWYRGQSNIVVENIAFYANRQGQSAVTTDGPGREAVGLVNVKNGRVEGCYFYSPSTHGVDFSVADLSDNSYKTILTTAATGGTFTVGETVTGGTSGATGLFVASGTTDGSSYVVLDTITGTFQSGEVITGGSSASTRTTSSTAANQASVRCIALKNLATDFGDDGFTCHFAIECAFVNNVSFNAAATYSSSSNGVETDDGSFMILVDGLQSTNNVAAVMVQGHSTRIPAREVTIKNINSLDDEVGINIAQPTSPHASIPAESVTVEGATIVNASTAALIVSGYSKVNFSGIKGTNNTAAILVEATSTRPANGVKVANSIFKRSPMILNDLDVTDFGLYNSTITGTAGDAISISYTNATQLVGNTISFSGDDGLVITGEKILVQGNTFWGNTGNGIALSGSDNMILNNQFYNGSVGMRYLIGTNNTIAWNIMRNNSSLGLRMTVVSPTGSKIFGNDFLDNNGASADWSIDAAAGTGADYSYNTPEIANTAEYTIPSATTTDLGLSTSRILAVSGTTPITSFGTTALVGIPYFVRFTGILTLTHNSTSLILPTGASITTAVGDCLIATKDASNNWRVRNYSRADGSALVGGGGGGGNMFNTGASVVGNIPRYTDTTGTNFAPASFGLGITNVSGVISNNIVAGSNVTIAAGASGQLTISSTGAGISDGEYGDIEVTGGGTTWTVAQLNANVINNGVVGATYLPNGNFVNVGTTNGSLPGTFYVHEIVTTNGIVIGGGGTNLSIPGNIFANAGVFTNGITVPTGLGITNINGILSNNIVAGSGVTITAGASGQLTIASPSGSGDVINGTGGSALNQLAFFSQNDGSEIDNLQVTLNSGTGDLDFSMTINAQDGIFTDENLQAHNAYLTNNIFPSTRAVDDTYVGEVREGLNAGTGGVTQWQAVYLSSSSTWIVADANGSGTYPCRGLALIDGAENDPVNIITRGTVRNDAWNWTPGGSIYLSETAGGLTQTAPTTSGSKQQIIGYALDADTMAVEISVNYVTAQ